MTQGHMLKALNAMNILGQAMDDVKDFISWAQGFRCYKQLKVMDDMNESGLWVEDSICY